MYWTKEDTMIMEQCAHHVEEVHEEYRKGVSQSKIVVCINGDETYWSDLKFDLVKVPNHLVGYWIMDQADDLSYVNYREAIREYNWVKCEMVEVVTKEWREL